MLVEVSGQRFVFPQQCACCGGLSNTTLQAAHSKTWGKRVIHTKTWSWTFPYCTACSDHIRSYSYAPAMAVLFALIVIVSGAVTGSSITWSEEALGYVLMIGIVLTIAAGIVGYIRQSRKARAKCFETCVYVGPAVTYVNWYGSVHSFNIVSSKYAALFMLANAKKLVNVTNDGRRLMEWGMTQLASASTLDPNVQITITATSPTPAAASPRNQHADDEQLVRCLAKLESLKGTASRRAALDAALRTIQSEELKQRLRVEAARIEVTAVLDKVDGLKTASAKKRHLLAALDDIRNDGVNDSMQVKQIEMLEAALREVETSSA